MKEPDYLFQKATMFSSVVLLIEGIILYLMRNLDWLCLVEILIAIPMFWVGVLMIDWEAKLYYKALSVQRTNKKDKEAK
jgi:pilus assembly protein TadC